MSGLPVDLVPTHDETRRLEMPEGHEATEEQVAVCAIATKPEQVLRGMRQRDGRGTFPKKLVVPPPTQTVYVNSSLCGIPNSQTTPRPKSLVRVRPQHGDFEAPKMPVKTPACSTRSSSRSRPGAPPAVPAAAASSDAAEAPQAAEKAAEPEATPEEAALEPQEEGSERAEGPAMEKSGAAEPSASALEAPNPEAHTAEESDVGEEAAPAQALAETPVAGELVQEVAEASELLDPPGITSGTWRVI